MDRKFLAGGDWWLGVAIGHRYRYIRPFLLIEVTGIISLKKNLVITWYLNTNFLKNHA